MLGADREPRRAVQGPLSWVFLSPSSSVAEVCDLGETTSLRNTTCDRLGCVGDDPAEVTDLDYRSDVTAGCWSHSSSASAGRHRSSTTHEITISANKPPLRA